MVLIYFFTQKPTRQAIGWFILYGLISIVTMLAMFPYLWQDTVHRLIETFISMSTNPISIFVLFNGVPYHADDLPRRFFPTLLILTLTEPVWPLFALGIGVAVWRAFKRRVEWISAVLVLAWFILLFVDVVINPPPIYDGSYRRMIFILPPVFIFAGFAFDFLLEENKQALDQCFNRTCNSRARHFWHHPIASLRICLLQLFDRRDRWRVSPL